MSYLSGFAVDLTKVYDAVGFKLFSVIGNLSFLHHEMTRRPSDMCALSGTGVKLWWDSKRSQSTMALLGVENALGTCTCSFYVLHRAGETWRSVQSEGIARWQHTSTQISTKLPNIKEWKSATCWLLCSRQVCGWNYHPSCVFVGSWTNICLALQITSKRACLGGRVGSLVYLGRTTGVRSSQGLSNWQVWTLL